MGLSITYKILKHHLVSGKLEPGNEIGIKIDQTLTQDATGTMAYLEFIALGIPHVKTELSVSYVDHNTLQVGYENADDHKFLMSVAKKYGIYYSKPGNGICHQVHLERFGIPGKTLLGSDSHTPTGGGIGMMAIGAGGMDVALAMAGEPFFLVAPKVIRINLHGKLKPWVTAKDVILKVLEILTSKGNVGYVVEYSGEGVKTLDVPSRATITNMGAELGVTTSIFPSDETTYHFMRAQMRERDWVPLEADPDAEYDRVIDIDLGELVPMMAKPHNPDNVATIEELEKEKIKVDQVAIGSCTNSSYKDLMTAATILEGKVVHPDVSLIVAPGSKQVFRMIAENGALAKFIAAGARIMESACGFCIGNGQAPPNNGISVRTNNRNFLGRSGTKTAKIYLSSPAVAAVTALEGYIVDPRKYGDEAFPQVEMPDEFIIDDTMIFPPSPEPEKVEIYKGPNIGDPPAPNPVPETLKGVVTIKVGDKITTDHIMPAGERLKYRSNIPKYSEFVFEVVDPTFSNRSAENRDRGIHNIIVGGWSYGQGSSREHAAICPAYLGIKAVLAKTIERIHQANLCNFGIVPLLFINEADYDMIDQNDEIEIPGLAKAVGEGAETVKAIDKTKNKEFELKIYATPLQREELVHGGKLPYTKQKIEKELQKEKGN